MATHVNGKVHSTPRRNILIVGAGLGGLAAAIAASLEGHEVVVLEAASKLAEVGAGIQITPNSARLLIRWGLDLDELGGVRPKYYEQVRWKNGESLSRIGINENGKYEREYGVPYWHVHRADLHEALVARAKCLGVDIKVGRKVGAVDFDANTVTTDDGVVYGADVIVGADGLRSTIRREMFHGEKDTPLATGDCAYRGLIEVSKMREHPDLAELADLSKTTVWMGPERHLVGYKVRRGELYNLVILVPDRCGEESWTLPGDMDELRAEFKDWEPRVRALLSLMPKSFVWKLCVRAPLTTWIRNHVVLLGDAAHAMLPYLAQGSAAALEDAAVLVGALEHYNDVSRCVELYETLRMPRTSNIQLGSTSNREYFHFHDGPEQEARDALLKNGPAMSNPNKFANPKTADFIYSYDADREVRLAVVV